MFLENPGPVFEDSYVAVKKIRQGITVSNNLLFGDVFRILSNNYGGAFWEISR